MGSGYQTEANAVVSTLEQARAALQTQLSDCERQLAALDAALSALQPGGTKIPTAARSVGSPAPAGGFRKGSLKDHLLTVLRGGGVQSIAEITAAVLRAGFKTKNKTLDKSVGLALASLAEVKKVRRGQYQLA